MKRFPKKLREKIVQRANSDALRSLKTNDDLIDFSSNDYLGFAKSQNIFEKTHQFLVNSGINQNGATGSRLLSGNHSLYPVVEDMLCNFHKSEAALVFNSGYDANIGFFSSVPQRGDIIMYDELIHASIRDGIKMSNAKSYKFKHNDLEDLKVKCETEQRRSFDNPEIYVVTESVFSMDGDSPDLQRMVELCETYNANLIVDEAHAIGVLGENGLGLVQELQLTNEVFARIVTFGKAMGCHGAAILGDNYLKQYLVNFARSFIYTTALPPHGIATIKIAYDQLLTLSTEERSSLERNIEFFKIEAERLSLKFIDSNSAIQSCIISGNAQVKLIAEKLQESGFEVKPILSPTVPQAKERLRFCLHTYNSEEEITNVLENLATFV